MKITLLCNAGLMLEYDNRILLVDAINGECPPFYTLSDDEFEKLCFNYDVSSKICGLYFTHVHPDHYDQKKVDRFRRMYPEVPIFLPTNVTCGSTFYMGPFLIQYQPFPHAPIPNAPDHVVTWIEAGECSVYIPADAALDATKHLSFVDNRKASIGIWNAMYLSRAETRSLIHRTADRNYIYHMPLEKDDTIGIWRKCRLNLERYQEELRDIIIMEKYPSVIL